jgi:hypothetical protein
LLQLTTGTFFILSFNALFLLNFTGDTVSVVVQAGFMGNIQQVDLVLLYQIYKDVMAKKMALWQLSPLP